MLSRRLCAGFSHKANSAPAFAQPENDGGGGEQQEAAKQAATDERVRSVINSAGSPIQYMDAPEFKVYWDKESAQMVDVVRKIGKVE